jgi:hypothetical protein
MWHETCVQGYQIYLMNVAWVMHTGLSEILNECDIETCVQGYQKDLMNVIWYICAGLSEILNECDMRHVYRVIRNT